MCLIILGRYALQGQKEHYYTKKPDVVTSRVKPLDVSINKPVNNNVQNPFVKYLQVPTKIKNMIQSSFIKYS